MADISVSASKKPYRSISKNDYTMYLNNEQTRGFQLVYLWIFVYIESSCISALFLNPLKEF